MLWFAAWLKESKDALQRLGYFTIIELELIMNPDEIATNFIRQAIEYNSNPRLFSHYSLEVIKDFYVPWDGEKVGELADGTKISLDKKEEKEKGFNYFKNLFLEDKQKELTIFAITKGDDDPVLIIDGVHRAVGLQRAINKSKGLLNNKINLILVLFKSLNFHKMPEYIRLLNLI